MPAASAKAVSKKRLNFQLKRRAKADAKFCQKPAVQRQLRERDDRIAELQRQLIAKQADSTRNMNKAYAHASVSKTQEAKLTDLNQRLLAAVTGKQEADLQARSLRDQLEQALKKNEEVARQNKVLLAGWQAWSNVKSKLAAPKTSRYKWKDESKRQKDLQLLRFLEKQAATRPYTVSERATPHGWQ